MSARRTGHISRQGQAHARALLCEAANSAVRVPGPLRAFFERLRTRRGFGIALVATVRKLAVIAWHMLTEDEDYGYEAPSLTQTKLRALERKAQAEGPRTPIQRGRERKALERRCSSRPRAPTATWSPLARRARGPTGDALLQAVSRPTTRGRLKVPKRLLFSSGVARAGTDLRRPPLTFSHCQSPPGLGGDVRPHRLILGPAAG